MIFLPFFFGVNLDISEGEGRSHQNSLFYSILPVKNAFHRPEGSRISFLNVLVMFLFAPPKKKESYFLPMNGNETTYSSF